MSKVILMHMLLGTLRGLSLQIGSIGLLARQQNSTNRPTCEPVPELENCTWHHPLIEGISYFRKYITDLKFDPCYSLKMATTLL